jgi:hypothetical protein
MHRLILGITDAKLDAGHRDGDGLNNCRNNLRVATRLQNGSNQQKRANSNTYTYRPNAHAGGKLVKIFTAFANRSGRGHQKAGQR